MDAHDGRTASGYGTAGAPAQETRAGAAGGAPSSRLAAIRDDLLRAIEEQGAVPLTRPPARWPLTREHAAALIERLAREGRVEITRNGDGAVARVAGADTGAADGAEVGQRA